MGQDYVKLVILGDITKGHSHKITYDLLKNLDGQGKIESWCLGNRDLNELYLAIIAEMPNKSMIDEINGYCKFMIGQQEDSYSQRRNFLQDLIDNPVDYAPHLDNIKKLAEAKLVCKEILKEEVLFNKFNLFVNYHQQFTMGNPKGYEALLSECGGEEQLFGFYASLRGEYASLLEKAKLESILNITDDSAVLFQHADHNSTNNLCKRMYNSLSDFNGIAFDKQTIQQAQVLWQARTGSIAPGDIDPKFTVDEKILLIDKAQKLGVKVLFVAHGHKPSAGPSVYIERDKKTGIVFIKGKFDGSLANILAGKGSKTQFGAKLIIDNDSGTAKLHIPSYEMNKGYIREDASISPEAERILSEMKRDPILRSREIEIDLKTGELRKGACSTYIDLNENGVLSGEIPAKKRRTDGGSGKKSVLDLVLDAGEKQSEGVLKEVFPLENGLVLLRGQKGFAPIKVIITEEEYNQIFTNKLDVVGAVDITASSSSCFSFFEVCAGGGGSGVGGLVY